ncbi:hypothetical protein FOA43_004271 [Brettanomyces nanus]|uniref:non-specific serine/threonine protein kinase n=1 Tax=Eeniella nana TaxID=13502 RepID=A0A875RXG8_EENNA|nr:uncharacterized protein FOA43_004271 [Brettanomyces nanus]QPG76877.1 hypothetical protein FOA43_004271 [Brettanomyces nanus]
MPPSQLNSMSNNFKASMDEYLQYEKGSLLNNRYRFLQNLQNGSFGKVTCALDTTTNQKVAIKSMKRSVPGVSFMARHEISIMKRLGYHANICQLLDSFETRKYVVMVLEYIPNGDLYDAIHNHSELGLSYQEDPDLFAKLCQQLVDVIKYAHSKGIYHRDVKPENVLLMSDGNIQLCDWGLATSAINCRDFNVGTEKYMAPEALGKHSSSDSYNSKDADTWSIGITLLFTLFGKCPFRKALPTDINYSNFIKSKAFLYDYYPNLSSCGFSAIVEKFMLDRDLDAGLNMVCTQGTYKGFTLDQEYKYELLKAESQKSNRVGSSSENLGGEFYMFDQEPVVEDEDYIDEEAVEGGKAGSGSCYDSAAAADAIDISSVQPVSKLSASSSSAAGNSLFDNVSTSIINSVDTIPEEEYMATGKKEDQADLDIDHYIMNFQNILKTQDQPVDKERLSENVLSNETLCNSAYNST